MALVHRHGVLQPGKQYAPAPSGRPSRYWHTMVTRASSGDPNSTSSGEQGDQQAAKSADVTRALPNKGYFSLADPNAEVYSKAGEKFDPTKKPGRYKPEFIWNTNWQETLKIQEQLEQQRKDYEAKKAAGEIVEDEGFLNMSRLAALNDMDVDLTPLLLKKREPLYKPATTPAEPKPKKQQRKMSSDLPTVREAKRYVRSNKAAVRNAPTVIRLDPVEAAEVARQAAIDRERYDELKLEFQLWTLGALAIGGVTAYAVYGEDLAISYVLGAVAGLTYLRLLSKSVDSLGTSGGGGAQPRLLIPVILVLASTKWNKSYADTYGYHLELIPMLLGFFTYKFAVIGRQSLQLMNDFTADMQRQRAGWQDSSSGSGSGEGGEGEAAKPSKQSELEKLFISKVWQQ